MGLFQSFISKEVVVGVDVTEGRVLAAHLGRDDGGSLELLHAGWLDIPPEAGEVAQAAALRRLWSQCGLPSRTVCSCLHARTVAVKTFAYRNLSPAELESALRLEAEQLLQAPRQEVLADWHVDGGAAGGTGEGGASVTGILFGVRRRDATDYLGVLRRARLYPVVLDVACLALANLFLATETHEGRHDPVLLVSLAAHSADTAVLVDGRCVYPRTVLSRAAPWEKAVDFLVENLTDVLRFYATRWHERPIERLVFAGHLPQDPEFLGRVQKGLDLPVEVWNPLRRMRVQSAASRVLEQRETLGPAFATALGLAMRNLGHGAV